MPLIEESFSLLFCEKQFSYEGTVKYSGKFKGYNANMKVIGRNITVKMSRQWKGVAREIQIGLVQSLLAKLFKTKKKTMNMEMYDSFLRNVHMSVIKTKTDDILEESFDRVNEKYFLGLIEMPNLVIGKDSFSRFGTYDYGTDTITISRLIVQKGEEVLDYIMYHELLHKKLKFFDRAGKSVHHSAEFRKMESEFPRQKEIEQELSKLYRRNRFFRFF